SHRAKNVVGRDDELEVVPFFETPPKAGPEMEALRAALRNNPAYVDAVISRDGRTAAVLADFETGAGGHQGLVGKVPPLLEKERDTSVEIAVGGRPVFLAQLERYSERAQFLFPVAVLVVGLIHYEAFRTLQGLILPLVTALLAVVWGLGMMGLVKA